METTRMKCLLSGIRIFIQDQQPVEWTVGFLKKRKRNCESFIGCFLTSFVKVDAADVIKISSFQ